AGQSGSRNNDIAQLSQIRAAASGTKKILLPAVEFQVTSNCFSALRRLRLADRPRILWIDAVSIDQHNFPERNHQVTLMSQIYSGASEVIIYLGESDDNFDLAIEFITELDNPDPETTTSLSYPKSEPLLLALKRFFCRPW
ncbi:hypothetical protein EWS82_13185, partial [Staphylococcus xylosus]|nr:hypothetical protein [Staphylococcus xylosus]